MTTNKKHSRLDITREAKQLLGDSIVVEAYVDLRPDLDGNYDAALSEVEVSDDALWPGTRAEIVIRFTSDCTVSLSASEWGGLTRR